MLGVAHNRRQRCATTTAGAFISGLRSRIQALPYFVHMVATWVFDYGLGPARKLAWKAASFREFPNQGLERV
ncbi:hypothetical protein ACFSQT_07735 [Mesorhizobium calcicola]|uniref:Transposase n=1 Tax=Mesorhizobium calcicola TaxID=1300310 RepID=A0ABW4WAI6_9HYPH